MSTKNEIEKSSSKIDGDAMTEKLRPLDRNPAQEILDVLNREPRKPMPQTTPIVPEHIRKAEPSRWIKRQEAKRQSQ